MLQFKSTIDEWDRSSHPMTKDEFGIWSIVVPPLPSGICAIPHDSKVKVHVYVLHRKMKMLSPSSDIYDLA